LLEIALVRHNSDNIDYVKRRQEIVRYFSEHGATKTAKHYGIARCRVYQIINQMLYGQEQKPKPEIPVVKRVVIS
jgi:hypothetical protein